MRVYIHYEDEGGDEAKTMTIKIKLPKSWRTGPVSNLKETFVEAYNKKHADNTLTLEDTHVATSAGKTLCDEDVVENIVENKGDVYIKKGPPAEARTDTAAAAERKAAAEAAAASKEEEETKVTAAAATATKPMSAAQKAKAEGKVRCRAYGCNEWFKEDENHDGACTHHVAPPLFHEGRKAWSCCPDNKAYDWDGFMAIRGCATSKHTTVAPEQLFAASPTVAMAERANEGAGMKSAADFEAENPEPTAAKAAAKPRPKPRDDGKARCVNGGCQQLYVVADNTDTACKYHKGQAVFHDRGKHWSCCPDKKAWTWEDFMAVEPCTTGPHRDWIPPEE